MNTITIINDGNVINASRDEARTLLMEIFDVKKPEPVITTTKQDENDTISSIRELAEELKCSIVTAQKLKNSGKIPYQQFGRKVLFSKKAVKEALIKTRKK